MHSYTQTCLFSTYPELPSIYVLLRLALIRKRTDCVVYALTITKKIEHAPSATFGWGDVAWNVGQAWDEEGTYACHQKLKHKTPL